MTERRITGFDTTPTSKLAEIPAFARDVIPDDARFDGMVFDDGTQSNYDMYVLPDGSAIRSISEPAVPYEIRINRGDN